MDRSRARLIYFLVALLPVVLVFFQHEGTMPLFMVQELGFSEAVYGSMFTINTVLIVLLEPVLEEVVCRGWLLTLPRR